MFNPGGCITVVGFGDTAPINLRHNPPFFSQLALCSSYMAIGATVAPSAVAGQIYFRHSNITAQGIRIWVPWMIIATGVRIGLLLHFGDKGWYDAAMVMWAAAVWYWNVEYWVHGTVLNSQYVISMTFDASALAWMWLARDAVTGG